MRPLASLTRRLVIAGVCALALIATGSAAAYPDPANRQQTTVALGIEFTADGYLNYKVTRNWQGLYPAYDWGNDGCSVPFYVPMTSRQKTFFTRACVQHDFCYRNGKRFFRFVTPLGGSDWNHTIRLRCDNRFRTEMYRLCDRQRASSPLGANHPLVYSAWVGCKDDADVFYWAVRNFG